MMGGILETSSAFLGFRSWHEICRAWSETGADAGVRDALMWPETENVTTLVLFRCQGYKHRMVWVYPLNILGCAVVNSPTANSEFRQVAHFPIFGTLGYRRKENSGKSWNHVINLRKKYEYTPKVHAFLPYCIYIDIIITVCVPEAKNAKVAHYPVSDNIPFFNHDRLDKMPWTTRWALLYCLTSTTWLMTKLKGLHI